MHVPSGYKMYLELEAVVSCLMWMVATEPVTSKPSLQMLKGGLVVFVLFFKTECNSSGCSETHSIDEAKSTSCFSRGPRFSFQHSHGGSQLAQGSKALFWSLRYVYSSISRIIVVRVLLGSKSIYWLVNRNKYGYVCLLQNKLPLFLFPVFLKQSLSLCGPGWQSFWFSLFCCRFIFTLFAF